MKKFIIAFLLAAPALVSAQIVQSSSMFAPPITGPFLSPSVTSLPAFSTATGTPSSAQTFTLVGTNLTNPGALSGPTGYEFSTNGFSTSGTSTLSFPLTGTIFTGQPITISVRLTGASAGSPGGNISIVSTGASTVTIGVTGTVTNPFPTLTVTGSFSAFNTVAGTESSIQTQTLSGSSLTNNVVITPPTPIVVSVGGSYATSQTVTQSGGNLPSQPITVSYKVPTSATAQTISGSVTYVSTGATTRSFAVNGTVTNPSSGFTVSVNMWDSVGGIGNVSTSGWNNWGVTELNTATYTSQAWKDMTGAQTTIFATIGNINSNLDQGAGYLAGQGSAFPDAAFRNAIYKDESSETFIIRGVATHAAHYTIKLACSRATATDRNVTWTIHGTGISGTVNAKNNSTLIVLSGVDPDVLGNIQLDITDDTGFWYLNAWSITAN